MKTKPEIGKIYRTNDKLFGNPPKPRNVVVSKFKQEKKIFGVSRILSLEGKINKINTLMPIERHNYFTKDSGVDYAVYFYTKNKKGERIPINFGSMVDVEVYLSNDEIQKLKKHIKKRGGKKAQTHYKHLKRKRLP